MDADYAKGYKARGIARAQLGLWEEAAKDLRMASKLDFDEETVVMLRKVTCIISSSNYCVMGLFLRNKVFGQGMELFFIALHYEFQYVIILNVGNLSRSFFKLHRLNQMQKKLKSIVKNMNACVRKMSREKLSLR